jgi:hypothetical protein
VSRITPEQLRDHISESGVFLAVPGFVGCGCMHGACALLQALSNHDGIMVAGMTPSMVKAGFVSAILSAGFHVDGGHYSPDAIHAKVAEIQSQISAGVDITLNSLYNVSSHSSCSCGRR